MLRLVEFADIFLSKACNFYFGTDTGIIDVPKIFVKPLSHIGTDILTIYSIASHIPMPFIPKIALDKYSADLQAENAIAPDPIEAPQASRPLD